MLKLCLLFTYIFTLWLSEPKPENIRRQLIFCVNSSKTTDSLYNTLNNIEDRSALITGYMATLQALKAKHSWNPFMKVKYLNNAEDTFATAVAADPHNIEIRFMRFSVEHYVPGFLGDNKNLYADREEMIADLKKRRHSSADKDLITAIIKFLLESKRCTPAENAYLTKTLTTYN